MSEELPYDTSDPKMVKDAKKGAISKALRNKEALRTIMSQPEGRLWMHTLLVKCGPFRTPFSTDPIMMAKNCGEASIGLQLIADLHEASTELYLAMMKENG